jgi:hypothetical protein
VCSGEWYNAGAHTCDAIPSCIGQQTYNSANNTCTLPTCTASQWYNSGTGNCDVKVTCIGQQTYNSANNTCTLPTCNSSQWYNAGTGNCDAKVTCIGDQTYNSGSNTCSEPVCSGEWYNAAAHTCDAYPTCLAAQIWSSTTNGCSTLPAITKCFTSKSAIAYAYPVLSGYSGTPTLYTVTDPGLTGDVNPSISGSNIQYTTKSGTGWTTTVINFTFRVSYVQNGVTKYGTQNGTLTITRRTSGSNTPTSTC